MNTVFAFAFLGLIYSIYNVAGISIMRRETCTTNSDCTSTSCSGGNTIICQHPNGTGIVENGGLCTCAATSSGCQTKADCYGNGSSLNCADSLRHCYDNVCICDRFPPTGK